MYGDKWPCDINTNEVVNHVIDPDLKERNDIVFTLEEKCVCNGEEVDITHCHEQCNYTSSNYPRKCIIKSRRERRPVRHHGGLNKILWKYYLLLAARSYIVDNDRLGKCCEALARALHYAQDGVLSRRMQLTGVLGIYTSDDLHDIVGEELNMYIHDYLRPETLQRLVKEGVNAALRESPTNISASHEFLRPDASVTTVIENMVKATAYTIAKLLTTPIGTGNQLTRQSEY